MQTQLIASGLADGELPVDRVSFLVPCDERSVVCGRTPLDDPRLSSAFRREVRGGNADRSIGKSNLARKNHKDTPAQRFVFCPQFRAHGDTFRKRIGKRKVFDTDFTGLERNIPFVFRNGDSGRREKNEFSVKRSMARRAHGKLKIRFHARFSADNQTQIVRFGGRGIRKLGVAVVPLHVVDNVVAVAGVLDERYAAVHRGNRGRVDAQFAGNGCNHLFAPVTEEIADHESGSRETSADRTAVEVADGVETFLFLQIGIPENSAPHSADAASLFEQPSVRAEEPAAVGRRRADIEVDRPDFGPGNGRVEVNDIAVVDVFVRLVQLPERLSGRGIGDENAAACLRIFIKMRELRPRMTCDDVGIINIIRMPSAVGPEDFAVVVDYHAS